VAANLLVRRRAFEQVGGFYEGLRAAEDTDFSWRLQEAGWRLALRAQARVEHRYRATLGELRRQWRGYAAGRAWLARRYRGFRPEPAASRAVRRLWRSLRLGSAPPGRDQPSRGQPLAHQLSPQNRAAERPETRRTERVAYAVLDVILGFEELFGLTLSNRPAGDAARRARVQAVARPARFDPHAPDPDPVSYIEDDGLLLCAVAFAGLALAHPLLCLADRRHRLSGELPLPALAPAVWRLRRGARSRLVAPDGEAARHTIARLVRLAGG